MTIKRIANPSSLSKKHYLKPIDHCMKLKAAKALARNPDRLVFYYRRRHHTAPPLLFEQCNPITEEPAPEVAEALAPVAMATLKAEEAVQAQGNTEATLNLSTALKQLDLFAERLKG